MPSRLIIRSLVFLAALCGIGASAHAGIIVTVGVPCPNLSPDARKPADAQRPAYETTGETRCVVMPDGSTRCGKSIRVESVSVLPSDWRCTVVTKSVLYCETPSYGTSPGPAGPGDFDPAEDGEEYFDDEEIQTLGCAGGDVGAGLGWLGGVGVIGLVALRRRRVV